VTDSAEVQLLAKSLSACGERVESLRYSLNKNACLFPLTLESLKTISEDQKESIDAMILRYSQCVSMIQDQIFRGILLVEQEDIFNKSNRDKSLMLEKLGAIKSADEFSVAVVLRNKFAHYYPAESVDQIEKLNTLVKESAFAIGVFELVSAYVKNKHSANDHNRSKLKC
jgi:hypothetical protein